MSAVLPAGDHFERDGQKFVPIGHVEEPRILLERQDEYMARCASYGENVLHVPLEPVPQYYADAGTEKMWGFLWPIVDAAVKHGVRLSIGCYQPHPWHWQGHPFKPQSYEDLFGSRCTDLLRERLRYLVAKIPDYALFQLELAHEMPDHRDEWIADVAGYLRTLSPVMRSVSIAFPEIQCSKGWAQWGSPDLDFIAIEGYGSDMLFWEWIPGPDLPARRLRNVARLMGIVRERALPGKPVLCVEAPRTPVGWWHRLVTRPALLGISDVALARHCFDVGQEFLRLGAAGPGFPWSAASSGATVDGLPNALTRSGYEYQAETRRLYG